MAERLRVDIAEEGRSSGLGCHALVATLLVSATWGSLCPLGPVSKMSRESRSGIFPRVLAKSDRYSLGDWKPPQGSVLPGGKAGMSRDIQLILSFQLLHPPPVLEST